MFHDTCEFTETRAVTQRVMKGCHIIVHPWSSPEISVDGTSLANHRAKKSNKYGLLTKCEIKMTGYWPSSFFACLWTETKSRSVNSQKKNEANIQPS